MGTRDATRDDLKKLIGAAKPKYDADGKPVKTSAPKLFHQNCPKGRITSTYDGRLSCKKCGEQWGKSRPDTWSEQDISKKFWVETPPEAGVYRLVDHPGGYTTTELVQETRAQVEPSMAPKETKLDKLMKALGSK